MDFGHVSANRLQKIEQVISNADTHEGYSDYCLFIRKMKIGMHFTRLSGTGFLKGCTIKLGEGNQSLVYTASGGQLVELDFARLAAVADLAHAELTTSPQQLAVEKLLHDPALPAKALALVFQDEGAPPLSPADVDALGTGSGPAKAILAFGATQVPSSSAVPPSAASLMQGGGGITARGGTVSGGGLTVLVLVCCSVEAKRLALRGFRTGADYGHAHGDTHANIHTEDALGKGHKQHALAVHPHSCLGRAAGFLHHLYRPHHAPNHRPPRFHVGIVAEVIADESYKVLYVLPVPGEGQPRVMAMKHPCKVFRPGMFVRARITSFDMEHGTYDLAYMDGPYLGDESPDGHVAMLSPAMLHDYPGAVVKLVGVKAAFLTVDMDDNFGSQWPAALLALCAVQVFCFVYYVRAVLRDPVEENGPVGGPAAWWMRVIGEFPGCEDLRPQGWRLWSYQLVHAGSAHIANNMVLQLVFGLPLNMVHGNLRFFLMYQVGVLGGALAFVLFGGGQGALVGCSGGVYCIFGIHVAELLMNWGSENKGLLNHWTRLLILGTLLGLDAYLYTSGPSATTSYTAHIGGFMTGAVFGVLVLDNLEVTDLERYLITPFTVCFAVAMVSWATYNYAGVFPPEAFFYTVPKDSCCVQLLTCVGLAPDDYGLFDCANRVDVTTGNGRSVLEHCGAFLEYAGRF